MAHIRAMQEATDKGELQINVTSTAGGRPIEDASIEISYTGVPESMLERVGTDSSGQTEVLELDALADAVCERIFRRRARTVFADYNMTCAAQRQRERTADETQSCYSYVHDIKTTRKRSMVYTKILYHN